MNLDISERQKMLKKTAFNFLNERCPKSLVREMEEDKLGYKPALWKEMANLGWLGLILPQEYGGTGGSFLDLCVLLEEIGRALLPSPFLSTIIAQLIFLEAGSNQQKKNLLPKIAEGKLIVTSSWHVPGTEYDVVTPLKGIFKTNNYVLQGSSLFVPYAHVSDLILTQVYTGKISTSLFLVDTKITGIHLHQLVTEAKDKEFEVEFSNVVVPSDQMVGKREKGQMYLDKILPQVLISKSMEMLGGAQQVLEMSVGYAKQRVQFDQPIGGFQAVQHHCANMAIDLETSRFLAYRTASMLSEGANCRKEAYMTKARLNDAYRRIVVLGKQVHGGYGIMSEYDMQLYFRRQRRDELFKGDADFYREKVAEIILD